MILKFKLAVVNSSVQTKSNWLFRCLITVYRLACLAWIGPPLLLRTVDCMSKGLSLTEFACSARE